MIGRGTHEKSSLPIGVFDSGVGGLTVLKQLRQSLPQESFIYVGDTLNNPYGNRQDKEIVELALHIARFLRNQPVKMAVVACNTIAVTALSALQGVCDFPVVDVSPGVKSALRVSSHKRIGVMATAATIRSHWHKTSALALDHTVQIIEQSCPELAHLIEEGHRDDALIRRKAKEYVLPLVSEGVDTIILGCTHFPLIQHVLEEITGTSVRYVDPATETVASVDAVLSEYDLRNKTVGERYTDICFTADVDRGTMLGRELMGTEEFQTRKITL